MFEMEGSSISGYGRGQFLLGAKSGMPKDNIVNWARKAICQHWSNTKSAQRGSIMIRWGRLLKNKYYLFIIYFSRGEHLFQEEDIYGEARSVQRKAS